MQVLRAAFDDAMAGRGRLVLLSGEPGIGKTRTAEELATHAQSNGAQVVWGRCYEGEGAPAFWPWVEILRAGVELLAPAELGDAVRGTVELVQLLPSLRDRVPDLPDVVLGESAEARFRLFDAVASFLGRLAQGVPLLVIIDDLHGADRSSLLLLEFVSRALRQLGVLVVATYRDAEVKSERGLSDSLLELVREPSTQRLELRGLSREEVGQFVQARTDAPAPDGLVALLHERTEGNPLFVGEFVRLLVAEKRLPATDPAARWSITVPHGVRAVIERRLAPLSAACRAALRVAAVIGREFAWQTVLLVLLAVPGDGASHSEVETLVEEAEAGGVISRSTDAVGRWRFAHALIRETLYDGLRDSERAELHRAVGEGLEQMPDAGERLAELAHHFSEAARAGVRGRTRDERDKAVAYARRAADHAMRLRAYEEAVRLYQMAVVELERAAEQDRAGKCALLVDLGVAQNASGALEVSKQTLLQAAELAKGCGLSDQLARAALNFGSKLAWGESPDVDPVRVGLIESALEECEGTGSSTEAGLLARLALSLRFSDQHARRDAASERALEIARRLGDLDTLMTALNARHATHYGPHTWEERQSIAAELVEVAKGAHDLEMTFEAEGWRLDDAAEVGDRATLDAAFMNRQRLAKQIHQPFCHWVNAVVGASLLTLEGCFADAERRVEEALAIGGTVVNQGAAVVFTVQMVTLGVAQGRRDGLESIVETLRGFVAQFPSLATFVTLHAYCAAELERHAETRQCVERLAVADFQDIPRDQNWLITMGHLAAACAFLGDTERVRLLYELLSPYESRAIVTPGGCFFQGPVALHLGVLAASLRRSEAAEHFERALWMNTQMRARPWLARTQYEYARMLLRSGQPRARKRAHTLLADALATARELTMPLLIERAQALQSAESSIAEYRDAEPVSEFQFPTADSVFRREGHYWTIAYAGKVVHLKDSKGVQYLAYLLGHPGRESLAIDLIQGAELRVQGSKENQKTETADRGPATTAEGLAALDTQARYEYRQRVQELRADLAEAGQFNDLGRMAKLKEEIDFLARQLNAAVDLYGKDRKVGAAAERARLMVTKRIKSVLKTLDTLHPPLAHHLRACVKTGYCCAYAPPPGQPVTWKT